MAAVPARRVSMGAVQYRLRRDVTPHDAVGKEGGLNAKAMSKTW